MRIAVIPARSGSKSIPEKNLVPIMGKPLIYYVSEAIIKSNFFDRVVINSDGEKYLRVAHKFGFDFYQRSEELSHDKTDINDVLLDMSDRNELNCDWIYVFQPTSPFIKVETIHQFGILEHEDSDLIQSISKVNHNSHSWNQRVVKNNRVSFVFPKERQLAFQKQQKPQHYIFGNLLALRQTSYLKFRRIWMPTSSFVEVNRFESFDLDTIEDVAYAEYLLWNEMV